MVLKVENRSEGGCDSGMTCWRVGGMDPPSPTLKPNSEKFASEFSEIFYRASLVICSSKKNIVATSRVDPDFKNIYNLLNPGFLETLFLTLGGGMDLANKTISIWKAVNTTELLDHT